MTGLTIPPHEKFFSQKDTSEDFLDTPGGYTWHAQPVYWIHLKDTSGKFFQTSGVSFYPPPSPLKTNPPARMLQSYIL